MTINEAVALLNTSTRQQLVDRAFGDAEVYWYKDGNMIAGGYFGRSSEVSFDDLGVTFKNDEASQLRYCGKLTLSERNDNGGNEE